MSIGEFVTKKILDLRPSIDNKIHGNGIEHKNTTEGLTIEIQRVSGAASESLNLHVFLLQDAQLNLESGRFHGLPFKSMFVKDPHSHF